MSIQGLSEINQPDNKGRQECGAWDFSHRWRGRKEESSPWEFLWHYLHSWPWAKFIPQLLCIQSKESTLHSEWEIHMEPTKAKGTSPNPHPKEWINTSQDGQTPSVYPPLERIHLPPRVSVARPQMYNVEQMQQLIHEIQHDSVYVNLKRSKTKLDRLQIHACVVKLQRKENKMKKMKTKLAIVVTLIWVRTQWGRNLQAFKVIGAIVFPKPSGRHRCF